MLIAMFLCNLDPNISSQDRFSIGDNSSAWRSNTVQRDLRGINGCPDDYSSSDTCTIRPTAPVGSSNHEMGLAIGFDTNAIGTSRKNATPSSAPYRWLVANSAQFGLCNLSSEAWHWSTNCK